MTKADLIKDLAAQSGQSASVVDGVLDALAKVTSRELGQGEDVTIPGIVKLGTKQREARPGRNPKTGETIQIAAKTVVTTKVLKGLADHVA